MKLGVTSVTGKNVGGDRLFWVALVAGFAVSMTLAFATHSAQHITLLLPQAGGLFVAVLLVGIGPGSSTTLFLLIAVAFNAVAYAGVIFLVLVVFRPPVGQ